MPYVQLHSQVLRWIWTGKASFQRVPNTAKEPKNIRDELDQYGFSRILASITSFTLLFVVNNSVSSPLLYMCLTPIGLLLSFYWSELMLAPMRSKVIKCSYRVNCTVVVRRFMSQPKEQTAYILRYRQSTAMPSSTTQMIVFGWKYFWWRKMMKWLWRQRPSRVQCQCQ